MTMYEVLIDGVVKMTFPGELHRDGTIWGNQGTLPLINGFLLEKAGITKEAYGAAVRSNSITPGMLSCCMSVGENPGGRIVRDKDAFATENEARREAAMSPIDREKQNLLGEIARAENKARKCDRSEDDVEFQRLTFKAEKLQADFYARFPEELVAARVARLQERAKNARRIADGAMLYDCDGTLSHDDQCERRDQGYAEAAVLEAQANELGKVGA